MTTPKTRITWNEFQHVGTDFADQAEVRAYDERMGRFRDFAAENERIFAALDLPGEAVVCEIGCGTGTFALAAARRYRRVLAYDVSSAMLDCAREKARGSRLDNVLFRRGGFLSCHEGDPPVEAVVTQFALHHLPDFWKWAAFRRMAAMLEPGGKLFLNDVVFSFPVSEYPARCERWIESLPPDTRENAIGHLSGEYSSPVWLIRELLERSGFRIERAWTETPFIGAFLCLREYDPRTLDDCSRCLRVGDEVEIHELTPAWSQTAFEWLDANREHLARWVSFPDRVRTPHDEEAFIRRISEIPSPRREFLGRIMVRGEFAGSIGTTRTDQLNQSTEIGYSLAKAFEGQGLMTRCCATLVGYLFEERGINRVVIRCALGNRRSANVAKRLGFRFEGVQRGAIKLRGEFVDAETYSLLKNEWNPSGSHLPGIFPLPDRGPIP